MIRRFFTIAMIVVSCGKSSDVEQALSPNDFRDKLNAENDAVILDVRTPEELASGYLQGSHNLDFRNENFAQFLTSLDKSKPYFVYCASGIRSGKAAEAMKKEGFEKVYTMEGGLKAWIDSGLPATSAMLPPEGVTIAANNQSVLVSRADSVVAEIQCADEVDQFCFSYRISVAPEVGVTTNELFYSRQEALDWVFRNLQPTPATAP